MKCIPRQLCLLLPLLLATSLLAQPPTSSPSSSQPVALTPEQVASIKQVLGIAPGQPLTLEAVNESATGTGASAKAGGDGKLQQNVTGAAPSATLGPKGPGATGGGIDTETTVTPGDMALRVILLVMGGLCLVAAAASRMIPIPLPIIDTVIAAVLGFVFITLAFYPALLIYLLLAIVAGGVGLYFYRSNHAVTATAKTTASTEALRAREAGLAEMPAPVIAAVDAATKKIAETTDMPTIEAIRKQDDLHATMLANAAKPLPTPPIPPV